MTFCRKHLRLTLLLATCLAVVSASAQTLLFNFPFNEGSGTNISSTVNTLPGTLGVEDVPDSAPTFSTDTPSGQAGDYSISFTSVVGAYKGNRIRVADPDMAIDVTDPITGTNRSFTFQCWVKFGQQPETRSTLFDNNGPGLRANIAIMGDRTLALTTYGIIGIKVWVYKGDMVAKTDAQAPAAAPAVPAAEDPAAARKAKKPAPRPGAKRTAAAKPEGDGVAKKPATRRPATKKAEGEGEGGAAAADTPKTTVKRTRKPAAKDGAAPVADDEGKKE